MSKLEKNLKDWIDHGFINSSQAQRIRDHEALKPGNSWILSGLLILGALIISVGVISLIAAHWNQIPHLVKLGGDFLLLVGLATAILHTWETQKKIQFEVLLLSFLLFCLASIGLISQIYHTGGEFYQALMLWSLITSAATLGARQVLIPWLWTGAFLAGLVCTALDAVIMEPIFHKNHLAVFMATPLLCMGLLVVSKRLSREAGLTRAFQGWTLTCSLFALVVVEIQTPSNLESHRILSAYLPGYFLTAFVVMGIWKSFEYRRSQKILLMLIIVAFLIPFHLSLLKVSASIAYATFTILVLGLISIFLASLKARKLFQWFLFFLGMRFLILYFQALGGLATTGTGLVVSGGIIIGMTMIWNKHKDSLATWAEGWSK